MHNRNYTTIDLFCFSIIHGCVQGLILALFKGHSWRDLGIWGSQVWPHTWQTVYMLEYCSLIPNKFIFTLRPPVLERKYTWPHKLVAVWGVNVRETPRKCPQLANEEFLIFIFISTLKILNSSS